MLFLRLFFLICTLTTTTSTDLFGSSTLGRQRPPARIGTRPTTFRAATLVPEREHEQKDNIINDVFEDPFETPAHPTDIPKENSNGGQNSYTGRQKTPDNSQQDLLDR